MDPDAEKVVGRATAPAILLSAPLCASAKRWCTRLLLARDEKPGGAKVREAAMALFPDVLKFDPLSSPLILPTVAAVEGRRELDRLRNNRCVIYARFSNTTDSPASIDRQVKRARAYAEAAGLTIVKIYEEPRMSGTSVKKRRILVQMIADLQELNIGHVVVESQDRLGRKLVVLAELWHQIHERGVPIHNARAGAKIDIVRWCVEAGFIEEERNKIVERLGDGIRKAAREGTPMMTGCFGYTRAIVNGHAAWAIEPDEAETVRFVYAKFNAGWSPAFIAAYLNAEVPGGRHGRSWTSDFLRGSQSVMSGMLRHVRYTGYQTYGVTRTVEVDEKRRNVLRPTEEWIISEHRPDLQIVTVEDFNCAQQRLASAAGGEGQEAAAAPYAKSFVRPLQGLVRCARCGGGMSAKADSVGNRQERFMCNFARNRSAPGAKQCDMGSGVVRYHLEDAFAEVLGAELVSLEKTSAFVDEFNASLASAPKGAEGERKRIERQLAEISRRVEKTWDDALSVGMTPHWIADIRIKLQEQEESLRERLSAIEAPAPKPLVLAVRKSESMLGALSGLMSLNRIDTSTHEGGELVASLRELVEAVMLDVQGDGSFTMRVVVRPYSMLADAGSVPGRGRVILEKRFSKAVRGYFGSPRFARATEASLAERRHCLSDVQWEAIRRLVPPRVAASRLSTARTVFDPRTVVEAALFHLQSGVPMRALPDCFGPPAETFNALRRLQSSGAWSAVEPVLRKADPGLFDGVKGSRTFPLCNPEGPPGRDPRHLSLDEKAASGMHRLSDREWAIAGPLVAERVTEVGRASERLDPRRLIDGVMFMLKERVAYTRMPQHFGPQDHFMHAVRRLVAHHCWDRIVEAFRKQSPSSLVGLDEKRFENHARSRNEAPVFRVMHDRDAIMAKLSRVRDLHERGTTFREAATVIGVSETQLHRWRADPRYRS